MIPREFNDAYCMQRGHVAQNVSAMAQRAAGVVEEQLDRICAFCVSTLSLQLPPVLHRSVLDYTYTPLIRAHVLPRLRNCYAPLLWSEKIGTDDVFHSLLLI